jgi:hypothetical protein
MHGVEHNGYEELTLLELVLQLHGEFRRSLEPIRLTPLQGEETLWNSTRTMKMMRSLVTIAAKVLL